MAEIKTKKLRSPSLRVIKILTYKEAYIMVQQIVSANIFQVIVFYQNNFYQAHEIIKPDKTQKDFTVDDLAKAGSYLVDVGFQMVDALSTPPMPAPKNKEGKVVN